MKHSKNISAEKKSTPESIGGVDFGTETADYSVGRIFETRFTLRPSQPERDNRKSAQQSSTCVMLPKYEVPRAEPSATSTTHRDLEVTAIIRDITGRTKEQVRIETATDQELFTPCEDFDSRFQIRETFAQGSFGTVSNAYDKSLARKIAVKTLHEKHQQNPDAIQRFINEARLTAQLDHPSIIPVYSFEKDSKSALHLSMKLIDGITLKTFISRIRVKHRIGEITQEAEHKSLRSRLELFLKICEAVEYAHSRETVHGDLKPENIMIGSYGEVYVMDWGTATEAGTVYSDGINGTPAYLAPELCETKTVSKSADVFALGLILFELVTLKYAFTGQTDHEVIQNICSGNIRQVSHTNPSIRIASDIAAIIRKAAEHDPVKRYKSPAGIRSDIRHFLFDEEVSANPRSFLRKAAKKMYQKKALTFAAGCIMIAVVAGYVAVNEAKKYSMEHSANEKLLKHLSLQNLTDTDAEQIENALNQIESKLEISAGILSGVIDTQKALQTDGSGGKIYTNSDYMSPSTSPEGMRSIYGFNRLASLEHANRHNINTFDDTPCRMSLPKQIFISFPDLTYTILNPYDKVASPEEIKKKLLSAGTFLRRQYIVLEKCIITYPGMYEAPNAINKENWNVSAPDNTIQWVGPFADKASGSVFLTCATKVSGTEDRKKAVICIETDFTKLLEMLKINNNSALKSDIVIFKDDNIIYYATQQSENGIFNISNEADRQELTLIKNELMSEKITQATIVKNNMKYIISIEKIPSINGAYIRLTKEKDLDRKTSVSKLR